MANTKILAGGSKAYVAPSGEAMPTNLAAIGGNWSELAQGLVTEEGVTLSVTETVNEIRSVTDLLPIDVRRTSQSIAVSFGIYDATPEAFKVALNDNEVTTTAAGSGISGVKSIDLAVGTEVTEQALLMVAPTSPSSGADGMVTAIYMPSGRFALNGDITVNKEQATIPFTYSVIKHPTLNPRYIPQTAAAS